ncbi:MAG: hypothetical protein WD115_04825 [Balneolaceae bacterium]
MAMDPIRSSGVIQLDQHSSRQELKMQEVADGFEKLFARHLVEQITKDSFSTADNSFGTSGTGQMVRGRIVDTLADALASERALGMADMVEHFWGRQAPSDVNETGETHDE